MKMNIRGEIERDVFKIAYDIIWLFYYFALEQRPGPSQPCIDIPYEQIDRPEVSMALSPVTEEELEQTIQKLRLPA